MKNKTVPRDDPPLLSLAKQVRGWADSLINVAGSATDLGLSLAQSRVKDPAKKAAIAAAGRQIRQWREAAGLTLGEVAEAVGLGDAKLIEQAEGGVVSLPFDLVLRLAGVLGRRDPLPVAMALTRQYNPELWKTLEALGIGKLAVQGTRERELVNLYRGSDAARGLSDAQFASVLAFTRQAFDLAVEHLAPATPSRVPAGRAPPADASSPTPPPKRARRARPAAAG